MARIEIRARLTAIRLVADTLTWIALDGYAMRHLFVAMLIAAPGICAAQSLLEFRKDLLAFDANTVEVGFILGARSGYDPEAMPNMLRKLYAREGSAPGLLGLHPNAGARMQPVQAMLQSARRVHDIGFPARQGSGAGSIDR